jgi:hypothetical protein
MGVSGTAGLFSGTGISGMTPTFRNACRHSSSGTVMVSRPLVMVSLLSLTAQIRGPDAGISGNVGRVSDSRM